ncbi:hypothetical protein [Mucilaginibacter ginkgonis]|uniref:Uncharacterized protein n=1 Tax=Mucilaginibacter ginkgonis TaxID=2682091 RepID=A0A6I4I744_9SPHI|nr:hypothetical protein [Mucilaginibacter ginkgonis]QQL49215.1 hypothetical protein GO620_013665 [Mucilaginibacter ginkgonis]
MTDRRKLNKALKTDINFNYEGHLGVPAIAVALSAISAPQDAAAIADADLPNPNFEILQNPVGTAFTEPKMRHQSVRQ